MKEREVILPSCTHGSDESFVSGKSSFVMPKASDLEKLTSFFDIFADKTRLSILFAIDKEELCVCDIAAALNMTKSAVSHQLRILRGSLLVKYHRDGKRVLYSLADDHVRDIIEKGLEHINE